MKKILCLILCLVFSFSLVGCIATSESKSLSITKLPETEFIIGTYSSIEDAVAHVKENLGLKYGEVEVTDFSLVNVTGFSTDSVGLFTATISYQGSTITFAYKVVPNDERYGFTKVVVDNKNTVDDKTDDTYTYYISDVAEYRNIVTGSDSLKGTGKGYPGNTSSDTTYVLLNDLDFENSSPWVGLDEIMKSYVFNGIFDGGNNKIKNLTCSNTIYTSTINNPTCGGLFYQIGNAKFMNITFDNCIVGSYSCKGVGLLGVGYGQENTTVKESFKVDSVTINENCVITGNANVGALIGYAYYKNVIVNEYTFKGLVSCPAGSANLLLGSNRTQEVEGVCSFTFTNCNLEGELVAINNSGGLFLTNNCGTDDKIEINKCNLNTIVYGYKNNQTINEIGVGNFKEVNRTILSSKNECNYIICKEYKLNNSTLPFEKNIKLNDTLEEVKFSSNSSDYLNLKEVQNASYYVITMLTQGGTVYNNNAIISSCYSTLKVYTILANKFESGKCENYILKIKELKADSSTEQISPLDEMSSIYQYGTKSGNYRIPNLSELRISVQAFDENGKMIAYYYGK